VDKGRAFWSNLLVNVVAGLLGLALGIVLTILIASRLAAEKLNEVADRLVRLVEQLREDKLLSQDAARRAVVFAVGLISESSLRQRREEGPISDGSGTTACKVCALEAETLGNAETLRCRYCHLPGAVWKSTEALQEP
jgi:hypothetical protein